MIVLQKIFSEPLYVLVTTVGDYHSMSALAPDGLRPAVEAGRIGLIYSLQLKSDFPADRFHAQADR